MKLSAVLLKERIPELGTSSFKAGDHWDLSFEAGLVTISRVDGSSAPHLIPVSNVVQMRPAATKTK